MNEVERFDSTFDSTFDSNRLTWNRSPSLVKGLKRVLYRGFIKKIMMHNDFLAANRLGCYCVTH